MNFVLLYSTLTASAQPAENPFDFCESFYCNATVQSLADAPLLFVGTLESSELNSDIPDLARFTWRFQIEENLRGTVSTSVIDVRDARVGPQSCEPGDRYIVAAQPISLHICANSADTTSDCVDPMLGDIVEVSFTGSMVCERQDGTLGSNGTEAGPTCFGDDGFAHTNANTPGSPCPPAYQLTFDDLLQALRASATPSDLTVPGLRMEP